MLEIGSWMLEVGCWKLDVRSSMLEVGCWKLDVGSWKLEVGGWTLDFGLWALGFGIWDLGFGCRTIIHEDKRRPNVSGRKKCPSVSANRAHEKCRARSRRGPPICLDEVFGVVERVPWTGRDNWRFLITLSSIVTIVRIQFRVPSSEF